MDIFRAPDLPSALGYIGRIFTHMNPWALSDETIYTLGLDLTEMTVLFWAIVLLAAVDFLKYLRRGELTASGAANASGSDGV